MSTSGSTTGAAGSEFIWSWDYYDGFGRPIQTQTFAENGAAINVVSSGYDLAGRSYWVTQPYQQTSGAGIHQPYSLGNTDRTVWLYDTDGLTTTRVYNGNTVEITSSTRTQGWQTTSTDGLGNTTVSMVDVDGNLVSVRDANNQTTTYDYNVRGDLITISDPVGNQIVNEYGNGTWSTQVTEMDDPDLGTITYGYDDAGRLDWQRDNNGNAVVVSYNTASQPTSLNIGVTNGAGGYNAGTDVVSSWAYDPSGRMISTTHNNLVDLNPSPTATNITSSGTVTTSLTYDARNRVTNESWTIPGLPGGSQDIDYTYRPLGAIDTVTYPNGTVVDYGFNKETEQPTTLIVGSTTVASGVRYNPAGQVTNIQRGQPDWTGADLAQLGTSFEYDYAQRIESISTVGLDQDPATVDALVRLYRSTLGRDPDTAGWGYWLPLYANGLALANIADAFYNSAEFDDEWDGYVDSELGYELDLSKDDHFVHWAYGHILDRPLSGRNVGGWVNNLQNNGWTRAQLIVFFSNYTDALTNPGIGSPDATTAFTAPNPADADVPQELAYTWDDAGNLQKVHETSEGVDQWQCFTYDSLHRLDLGYIHGSSACGAHQAIGPDPFNVDYAYNSIGNITSAAGTGTVSGSYTYGSTKPHAVTQAGSNSYAYDAAGNMTTRTTGLGTQTLVYDVLNRLVGITGSGDDMDALYDAAGTRVKRDLDSDVVYYLTDAYEVHNPASGPDTETIHLPLAGLTVGSDIDGTPVVSASDHLGSAGISRNNTGSTDTQRYTPYGAIRGGGNSTLPTDFTFTGQTDDTGTGLIDYNARHYDPQLGRFTQPDTILADGPNRFTYVRSNPLRYTDPTGRCAYEVFDWCLDGVNVGQDPQSLGTQRLSVATNVGSAGTAIRSHLDQIQTGDPDAWAGSGYAYDKAVELFNQGLNSGLIQDDGDGTYSLVDCGSGCDVYWWDSIADRLLGDPGGGVSAVIEVGVVAWAIGYAPRGVPGVGRGPCSGNSFVAGTEVLMADGTTKPIEEVQIGDYVWASNPTTGEAGSREVIDTIVGDGEKRLIDIQVVGGATTATAGHPFWVDSRGLWVDAGDLAAGDLLLLSDGSTIEVVATDDRVESRRVHNLSVAGIHTYFVDVGGEMVLVHNQSGCTSRPRVKPNKPASPPSWVTNGGHRALTTDANPAAAAGRIMNERYGSSWSGRGAGSEFSQIKKWLSRNFSWS